LGYEDFSDHDLLRQDPLRAVAELLTTVFVAAHGAPPERVVLDLDVTDLPLYIFAGEHLLCARLRTADQDASAGSQEEESQREIYPKIAPTGAPAAARHFGAAASTKPHCILGWRSVKTPPESTPPVTGDP
jgi:hypothetical protein